MLDRIRFVLVAPSHPGNVGACARAMKNMGLRDLALVAPSGFPSAEASARAAGAEDLLAAAQVHGSIAAAVADCGCVVATSSRRRGFGMPELAPRELGAHFAALPAATRCAVLFGPERIGLSNAQLEHASHLVVIPADPEYAVLNLAAAALIVAYELRLAAGLASGASDAEPRASAGELEAYYARLAAVLAERGILAADDPRHLMRRLRRIYNRAGLERSELQILQGMLTSLCGRRD